MPDKPSFGSPCNGCGLCCRLEVCELGLELGNRKDCKALVSTKDGAFVCGLVTDPYAFLPAERLASWRKIDEIQPGLGFFALKDFYAKTLSVGRGCDSEDPAEDSAHSQILPNFDFAKKN